MVARVSISVWERALKHTHRKNRADRVRLSFTGLDLTVIITIHCPIYYADLADFQDTGSEECLAPAVFSLPGEFPNKVHSQPRSLAIPDLSKIIGDTGGQVFFEKQWSIHIHVVNERKKLCNGR